MAQIKVLNYCPFKWHPEMMKNQSSYSEPCLFFVVLLFCLFVLFFLSKCIITFLISSCFIKLCKLSYVNFPTMLPYRLSYHILSPATSLMEIFLWSIKAVWSFGFTVTIDLLGKLVTFFLSFLFSSQNFHLKNTLSTHFTFIVVIDSWSNSLSPPS